jgi:hypothetical protein
MRWPDQAAVRVDQAVDRAASVDEANRVADRVVDKAEAHKVARKVAHKEESRAVLRPEPIVSKRRVTQPLRQPRDRREPAISAPVTTAAETTLADQTMVHLKIADRVVVDPVAAVQMVSVVPVAARIGRPASSSRRCATYVRQRRTAKRRPIS